MDAGSKNEYALLLNENFAKVKVKRFTITADTVENNYSKVPNTILFTYIADEISKKLAGLDLSGLGNNYPITYSTAISFKIDKQEYLDIINEALDNPVHEYKFSDEVNIYLQLMDSSTGSYEAIIARIELLNLI